MGTIYENGYEGIAVDRAKAFNCYEEASKLNNPMAFFHLGLMYEAVISLCIILGSICQ